MTTPCCRKINMPISSEVKSNNSHYAEWFGPILFLFFVCHIFSVCRGESSFQHLISWIFVPLFQGGSGSAYAKVHWGGQQTGETERGRSKSVTQTPVCESVFCHHKRQRRHPPRHKRMSSKCCHYRTCHLLLNRRVKAHVILP